MRYHHRRRPGREEEAAMRLGGIGFDDVAGYLEGGMQTLESRPELLGRTERVSAMLLAEQLASPVPPLVLDVRTPREWNDKHVEGSVNMPLNHLEERLGELSRNGVMAVMCAGGYRSAIATSLLQHQRFERVIELSGGIAAWEAAKLPVQRS
jgi:rhodanese-related sulfurtransferase